MSGADATKSAAPEAPAGAVPARRRLAPLARLRGGPALWAGALGILAIVLVAVFATPLSGDDALDIVARPYLWPGADAAHLLGTDTLGRDLWSGLAHGSRVSMWIGLQAGVMACAGGLLLGCAAGYFGGWVDHALMRLAELFQVMPSLLFTVVVVTVFEPTIGSIALAIALTSWPQAARLARAEAMRLRRAEFVQAASVMGMARWRIVLSHVVPNAMSPVVALLSLLAGQAILTEAALAFLGLGDPNVVSWGAMISAGRDVLRTAWYMTAWPGAAIFIAVLSLNLFGSGLNDLLNRRRGDLQ